MIARAAFSNASGSARLARAAKKMRKFRRVQRLADNARRGDEHLVRFAADGFDCVLDRDVDGLAPALAGERVGISGIDDEGAGGTLFQVLAAGEDGCRGGFRLCQDAGDRGPLVEDGEQKIGAPLIANTGFCRRKCHAVDRRQAGELGRRETVKRSRLCPSGTSGNWREAP